MMLQKVESTASEMDNMTYIGKEEKMNFGMTKKGTASLLVSLLAAVCGVVLGFDFTGNGVDANTAGIILTLAGAINAVLAFLMGKSEKQLDVKVQTLQALKEA